MGGGNDDIMNHRVARIEDDQKVIRERLHGLANTVQALSLKRDADHEISQQYRVQQAEHLARQDTKLDKIDAGVTTLHALMVGDGTDKNPGLSPRVATVERNQSGQAKFFWIVIGVVVSGVGAIIVAYIKIR